MKIKLVFDSTIVYTPEEAKERDIAVTPFIINDNGKIYHDNVDIDPKDFYNLWGKGEEYIKTSQPNIGETTELFKELLKEYDHILYCPLPEALSGTYATGKMIAKELGEDKITVVDLHTGAGMARVLADVGVKMIAEGKSVQEIVDHFMKASEASRFFITPYSMDGLKAGGRVSNITASIFGMIKLKICLYLTPIGAIDKFDISRTETKMMKQIIDKVKKDIGTEDLIIYLIYTDDESMLDEPKKILEKEFPTAEFQLMPLSPTLGSHTGPTTLGFHFCKKHW